MAQLDKGRPAIILSSDEAIPVLDAVVLASATTTLRAIPFELRLDVDAARQDRGDRMRAALDC